MSSLPYTFADHMAFCTSEGKQGRMASGRLVQVKKRDLVYCARIVNLWTAPNGLDCWTVEAFEPEQARFTVPCKQVRLCASPDDLCTCAKHTPQADRACFSLPEAVEGVQPATHQTGAEGVTCL